MCSNASRAWPTSSGVTELSIETWSVVSSPQSTVILWVSSRPGSERDALKAAKLTGWLSWPLISVTSTINVGETSLISISTVSNPIPPLPSKTVTWAVYSPSFLKVWGKTTFPVVGFSSVTSTSLSSVSSPHLIVARRTSPSLGSSSTKLINSKEIASPSLAEAIVKAVNSGDWLSSSATATKAVKASLNGGWPSPASGEPSSLRLKLNSVVPNQSSLGAKRSISSRSTGITWLLSTSSSPNNSCPFSGSISIWIRASWSPSGSVKSNWKSSTLKR